jgi:TolB protein
MMKPARRCILSVLAVASILAAASSGSATPPGTNGVLVFQKQVGRNTQLFTMAADGSGIRQLTHGTKDSVLAAWSPSGKTIAFARESATKAGIFLMRADGSGLRALTPKGLQDSPTFTPNGRWIVYSRALPTDTSLWVMDLKGKHQRRLIRKAATATTDESPAVSPDGKFVVFERARSETRSALFVVGLNGRGLRRITSWSMAAVGNLDWAPDGSRILFHTNDRRSQIHTIRADGTGVTTLTSGAANYCSGSFSPDGTQILLVDNCDSDSDTHVYSMPADGGALTPVPNGQGVHRVRWGPAAS